MTFRTLARFGGLAVLLGIAVPAATAGGAPVAVVEVFTSEGCSSCPPAEQMLSRLDQDSVISLEWHVDYWDYLGWKDRFGSAEATRRQYEYARTLPSQVYTPQAVINGTLVPEYAGNLDEVKTLVQRVLGKPPASQISLSVAPTVDPDVVQLKVSVKGGGGAAVLALLVEDGLSSTPTAGENAGAELRHTHVVRRSQLLAGTGVSNFAIGHAVSRANAAIVVLLQDQRTLRILAADRVKLPSGVSLSWNGTIVDGSGNPRAKVALQACSEKICVPGTTDENGSFLFSELPPGHYSLTVGSAADVVEVTLTAEGPGATSKRIVVP